MKLTTDANGATIKVGDVVAYYGYRDMDGYDISKPGHGLKWEWIDEFRVMDINQDGHIINPRGHVFPRFDILLIREGATESNKWLTKQQSF